MNWSEIQERNLYRYAARGEARGAFSVDGVRGAEIVGSLASIYLDGKICLDIGCGVLPHPSYMQKAWNVEFWGIDPYQGEDKKFTFFQEKAEDMHFADSRFDGVLFATSLDHVETPEKAISEARRVLRKDGLLFLWTSVKVEDQKYLTWAKKKKPALYDEFHLWAFTNKDIMILFKSFKFIGWIRVHPTIKENRESVYIFKK